MSADKSKVVAGVFIGMVLGIAAAGGVAWYVLNKKPTSFTNKEPAKPAAQVAPVAASAPAITAPVAASGVAESRQHFEFYKELTDKPDGSGRRNASRTTPKVKEPTVAKPKPASTATASKELYFVQAGSFQNLGDAEKLKAKLAFSGFEASIQDAAIPDKGVWHRVRLGPFSDSEAVKTISSLKQNGIIATQLRAQ
jgi:cell division protein FtsN